MKMEILIQIKEIWFRYPNPKTNHRFDQNDWEDFFVNDYDYEDEERRKKNAKKRKNRQNGHNGHSSTQVRGHSFFFVF